MPKKREWTNLGIAALVCEAIAIWVAIGIALNHYGSVGGYAVEAWLTLGVGLTVTIKRRFNRQWPEGTSDWLPKLVAWTMFWPLIFVLHRTQSQS